MAGKSISGRLLGILSLLLCLLIFYKRSSAPSIGGPTTPFDGSSYGGFDESKPACIEKKKGDDSPGRRKGRPIQFIHVPKAGGTSVQESLSIWAKAHGIPVLIHDGDGFQWDSVGRRGLFLGHRGFGYSRSVAEAAPITIIALREPVSRLISVFDYLRTTDQRVPAVLMIQRVWQENTLDEVVSSYRIALENDPSSVLPGGSASLSDRSFHRLLQAQIQFLCGYDCVWYMTGDKRESFEPFRNQKPFDKAKQNLENIDCVAVLDKLDDLLMQMKVELDFIPASVHSFPHENKIKPSVKSQPSAETLRLLKEWTREEQELFERARDIASAKIKVAAECLQSRH